MVNEAAGWGNVRVCDLLWMGFEILGLKHACSHKCNILRWMGWCRNVVKKGNK